MDSSSPGAEGCLSGDRTSMSQGTSSVAGFRKVVGMSLVNDQMSSFVILMYCFILYIVHRCLHVRQERRRQQEVLRDYEKQCEAERDAIANLKHSVAVETINHVPRRPRTNGQGKGVSLGPRDTHVPATDSAAANNGVNIQQFVSLSMFPVGEKMMEDLVYDEVLNIDSDDVRKTGLQIQNITVCKFEGNEGSFLAQTQIKVSSDVLTKLKKLVEEVQTDSEIFNMQLGNYKYYVKTPSGKYGTRHSS
jgi:hypothetical protein